MELLKKILFPTDFGENMDVALASAIKLAENFLRLFRQYLSCNHFLLKQYYYRVI